MILTLLSTAISAGLPAVFDGRRVLVRLCPCDRALWAASTEDDACLLVGFLLDTRAIVAGEA